jgi:hypothetical protein
MSTLVVIINTNIKLSFHLENFFDYLLLLKW